MKISFSQSMTCTNWFLLTIGHINNCLVRWLFSFLHWKENIITENQWKVNNDSNVTMNEWLRNISENLFSHWLVTLTINSIGEKKNRAWTKYFLFGNFFVLCNSNYWWLKAALKLIFWVSCRCCWSVMAKSTWIEMKNCAICLDIMQEKKCFD